MEIDFEILMLLVTSLAFTIAYFVIGEFKTKIVLNSLGIICWFSLAFMYVASAPSFPVIAMIFGAFGTIFTVNLVIGVTNMLHENKQTKAWR